MNNEITSRPILFSAPMVRAILSGTKTQTRRIVKLRDKTRTLSDFGDDGWPISQDEFGDWNRDVCPYGQVGDRLWVRETFYIDNVNYIGEPLSKLPPLEDGIYYRANGECCDQIPECQCASPEVGKPKWRPSIFMPRWASRITLEITDIRVERLNNIGSLQAMEEGIQSFTKDGQLLKWWPCDPVDGPLKKAWAELPRTPITAFRELWASINGADSWDANPWVWALEFKQVEAP